MRKRATPDSTTRSTGQAAIDASNPADSALPTRRKEWFPGLDGLRGFLLLIVFSVHLPPPFIRPLKGGYIVMEVFFVLSGFLITIILLREFEQRGSFSLRKFYARRAVRLLPAVLLFAAVVYVLTYVDPFLKEHGADNRRHALSSLSYLYNWIAIYSFNRQSGAPGYVAHLWSLSVEEQFYFVWPIALWLILRRLRRLNDGSLRDAARALVPWLIGAIVLSNVIRTLIGYVFENSSSYHRANWGTDARASGMLIGSLAAVVRLGLPELYARWRRYLPVAGCVALAVWIPSIWLFPREPNPFPFAGGFLLSELCSLAIILCLVERSIPPLTWLCEVRVMQWIGRISYSGYIIHFMLVGRFSVYSRPFRYEYPTVLALSLVLAGFSYRFVERPIAKWARRRFDLA